MPRWVELEADPDLPHGGANLKLLPEEGYLASVAYVVAHARGGITWEQAMRMPIPALLEAEARLAKQWEGMTF